MRVLYLVVLSWISVANSAVEYIKSDFALSTSCAGIDFYHAQTSNSLQKYAAAVIYGKEDHLGELPLRPKDNFFYLCTHDEGNYIGLSDRFAQIKEAFLSTSMIIPEPEPCELSSMSTLLTKIQESDNIYITFGAGISQGYVPTLLEVFNALGVEKVTSNDKVTSSSFISFVNRLFGEERERIFETLRFTWDKKVMGCEVDSTPAHQGLKKLIDNLTQKGKTVRVYTDNVDAIHDKLNITLSEQKHEGGNTIILYPPLEELRDKKTVVLVCGQSFDFHGVLSTIYARQHSPEKISFFSLNVDPRSIIIYEGLDVDNLRNEENAYLLDFNPQSLPMQLIQGSLHNILPDLYNQFSKLPFPSSSGVQRVKSRRTGCFPWLNFFGKKTRRNVIAPHP